MSVVSWVLIGMIMGAAARGVAPDRTGARWSTSLAIGATGAVAAAAFGRLVVGTGTGEGFFDIATWFWAFVGALAALAAWGALFGTASQRSGSSSREPLT